MERALLTYPTWERYTILAHVVNRLSVRDRRQIFQLMRRAENTPNLFFPAYGVCLAEFAVWHVLGDTRRKTKKQAESAAKRHSESVPESVP